MTRPTYSDRSMATDVVNLMRQLGHERFAVVGHGRGSYVAYSISVGPLRGDHAGLTSTVSCQL